MNDVKRRAYFNYLMLINMFCETTSAVIAGGVVAWGGAAKLAVSFVIMSFAFKFWRGVAKLC